ALLEAVAGDKRQQPVYWVARAGLAGRMRQHQKVLTLLDQAEQLLGPNAELRLARARHWARRPRAEGLAGLAQLEKGIGALPAEVARRRPAWSRVPLLEATLAEVSGDAEEAIKGYQAAIDRGERQPGVVRRVVQLLFERRRYVEADQVIRKLPEQAPISGDLV